MLKYAPISLVLMVFEIPMNVFLAYAGVYLPSLVIAEVINQESLQHAAFRIGLLILLMLLVGAIQTFTIAISRSYLEVYRFKKTIELDTKSMGCFFQTYEKKEKGNALYRFKYF